MGLTAERTRLTRPRHTSPKRQRLLMNFPIPEPPASANHSLPLRACIVVEWTRRSLPAAVAVPAQRNQFTHVTPIAARTGIESPPKFATVEPDLFSGSVASVREAVAAEAS